MHVKFWIFEASLCRAKSIFIRCGQAVVTSCKKVSCQKTFLVTSSFKTVNRNSDIKLNRNLDIKLSRNQRNKIQTELEIITMCSLFYSVQRSWDRLHLCLMLDLYWTNWFIFSILLYFHNIFEYQIIIMSDPEIWLGDIMIVCH